MSEENKININSDSQGFLIGSRRLESISKGIDQVDNNTTEILKILKATVESFGNKQSDTLLKLLNESKLLNKRMTKQVEAVNKNPSQQKLRFVPNKPTINSDSPINKTTTSTPSPKGTSPSPRRKTVDVEAVSKTAPMQNRQRDSTGRFVGAGGSAAETANFTNTLKTAFKSAVDVIATPKDVTGFDPSVDAIHELSTILSPATRGFRMMGRGAAWLFKRKTKRDEILPEEQSKHNDAVEKHQKEERKLLKRIAARSGGGNGLLGGLGGLLKGGGLLGGLLKGGGKGLGKLLKFGKGIPILGTALSAMSLMDWDKKTDAEKGGSVGSIAGGVAGGAIGSLLGPLGTVVGATVGSWAGNKLGTYVTPYVKDWTDSLKKADIPGRISSAWDTFVGGLDSYFSEKINNTIEMSKEAISTIQDKANSIADFGASVIDKALAKMGNSDAIERVKQRDNGQIGYQSNVYKAKTTNDAPSLWDTAKDTAGALISQPAEGLGGLSAKYESGRRGSGAVGWDSTGGTSYGKYQIASKTGTMRAFMQYAKNANPEVYGRLSAAGNPDSGKNGAFSKEWQKLAKEGKLGTMEHDFIKKSHYDVGMKNIKNTKLKSMVEGNKALQDVMWSTTVQHGGKTDIFNKVYKDGMSAEDMINAVYKERGTRFGSSTADVRKSVQNRFKSERATALHMNKDSVKSGTAKKVATTVIPATIKAPVKASPVVDAKAKSIVNSSNKALNSKIAVNQPVQKVGTPAPAKVKVPNPKVPKVESVKQPVSTTQNMTAASRSPMDKAIPQNISDRGLAHTATGGLGMNYLG